MYVQITQAKFIDIDRISGLAMSSRYPSHHSTPSKHSGPEQSLLRLGTYSNYSEKSPSQTWNRIGQLESKRTSKVLWPSSLHKITPLCECISRHALRARLAGRKKKEKARSWYGADLEIDYHFQLSKFQGIYWTTTTHKVIHIKTIYNL